MLNNFWIKMTAGSRNFIKRSLLNILGGLKKCINDFFFNDNSILGMGKVLRKFKS